MVQPVPRIARFEPKLRAEVQRVGRVTRLGKNEWTVPYPAAALREMLATISPEELVAIPELEPLYVELSRFLDVPRENLLLCPGSDAGIQSIFEAYVDEGDRVVVQVPTYHRYKGWCQRFGADMIAVGLSSDLTFPVHDLCAQMTPGTKLVVLVNPNSSTGACLDPEQLRRIAARAAAIDSLLLIDEAYHYFSRTSLVAELDRFPNLVVTRTFSKAFGLASARVGMVIACEAVLHELRKVKPRFEIGAVAARIASYALTNAELMWAHVREVRAGHDALRQHLLGSDVVVRDTRSCSVLIMLPGDLDRDDVAQRLLREYGYEVGAFMKPPLDQHLRVSLGPPEQMRQFADALLSTVAATREGGQDAAP